LHDGIEIDDRGTPAAVIVTEPFIPTVQAIADIRTLPDYRYAVIDHPIGSLDEVELRLRAKAAAAQIAAILLGRQVTGQATG
jgi:hypothetical protein